MALSKPTTLALALFVVVWACGIPNPIVEEASYEPTTLSLLEGDRVLYVGTFDWEGADWEGADVDSGVYAFANDLGHQFRISQFSVATHSVQLRRCDVAATHQSNFGLRTAHADHVVEDDPSIAVVAASEDGFAVEAQELGTGLSSMGQYCDAFLLATAAATEVLDGNSIIVAGEYRLASEDRWQTLEARIPIGEGALKPLLLGMQPETGLETRDGAAIDTRIVFTRYPVAAFEGLDPSAHSRAALAWELLGKLLAETTVHVQ